MKKLSHLHRLIPVFVLLFISFSCISHKPMEASKDLKLITGYVPRK